jgi:hypothetical protein
MKSLILIASCLFAACSFEAGGVYDPLPDASTDADGDAAQDAGADADDAAPDADPGASPATIACTATTVDGYPKVVLTLGGDIEAAFLGDDPAASPVRIAYGSDQEDLAVLNGCPNTWAVPYAVGCNKPEAAWGSAPQLFLEPEVDGLNLALIYDDGTVRWGDLKTSDGDAVGFSVSGLDCRVELSGGGTGGLIRTKP